jgi:hypothetical protein
MKVKRIMQVDLVGIPNASALIYNRSSKSIAIAADLCGRAIENVLAK